MSPSPDGRIPVPARNTLPRTCLRFAGAFLALAAGGMLLDSLSSGIRQEEFETGLRREAPDIEGGDALSQQLSIFVLGGLRSLAAELLSLDATAAWMDGDWPRAERRWDTVTTLAPHRVNYWATAARDMGVNAESAVRHDPRIDRVESASLSRRYNGRGVKFLQDGIANNPESAMLHCRLGDLLSDIYRYPSYLEAAAAYHKAVELGAPRRYRRQEFYSLCHVRGKEKEAYELGRELFKDENNQVPSVLCLLFALQNKLELPESERLGIEELFGSEEEAREYLTTYLYNALGYPVYGVEEFLGKH